MAFEVAVERGKIREFARAIQSDNADYDGVGAVAPPTFLTTAQNFWADDDLAGVITGLGLDMTRVLHGEEEYEFFGPPPTAGTVLSATSRLGEQWEKEGKRGGTMRFARVVIEFWDEAGQLVAEQRSTIIETAKPPTQEA